MFTRYLVLVAIPASAQEASFLSSELLQRNSACTPDATVQHAPTSGGSRDGLPSTVAWNETKTCSNNPVDPTALSAPEGEQGRERTLITMLIWSWTDRHLYAVRLLGLTACCSNHKALLTFIPDRRSEDGGAWGRGLKGVMGLKSPAASAR